MFLLFQDMNSDSDGESITIRCSDGCVVTNNVVIDGLMHWLKSLLSQSSEVITVSMAAINNLLSIAQSVSVNMLACKYTSKPFYSYA